MEILRLFNVCLAVLIFTGLAPTSAGAFEFIQISTAAPAGFETSFLAAMQAQFNVAIVPNPLASSTYAITVYGVNPSYNPPITSAQFLQQIDLDAQYMATVDSYTYVDGFANGQSYDQYATEEIADGFNVNCSTPIPNVPTWDIATCQAVAGGIDNAIFQESLSTPTVVPGGF